MNGHPRTSDTIGGDAISIIVRSHRHTRVVGTIRHKIQISAPVESRV